MEHDNEKTSSALTSCIRFGGGGGRGFLISVFICMCPDPFQWCPAIGQGVTAINRNTRNSA